MNATHERINLYRQCLAALTDLVWSAATIDAVPTHDYYASKRQEITLEFNAFISASRERGELTEDEAKNSILPITSLESARAFHA
ncbi:hypothetical protein [Streptomyces sioyaensis]|uniref:hypothetical protein n=1 Tax=Streptomyces sioyaensis TaxID=67364 RepID=UPI0036E7DE7E